MRSLGWAIAACGLVYMFFAFNMDVSVPTVPSYVPGYGTVGGDDVANIELMARRQNHLLVACVVTLIGALMGIFGRPATPSLTLPAKSKTDTNGSYEGQRDLSHDAYRLWLANEYEIRRHDVFDRFVVGDMTFESLEAALQRADYLENEKLVQAAALEQQREMAAEQARIESEHALQEAEAKWRRERPIVIAIWTIVALSLAALIYFVIEKNRIASEEALALRNSKILEISKTYGFELRSEMIANISEISKTDDYLCQDRAQGMLVRFVAKTEPRDILPVLDAALGDHETTYELGSSGEWGWSKGKARFTLSSIMSKVTLCITE